MAWPDVMIPMLRVLINDYDDTLYEYSDDRLQTILMVAAQFVQEDIEFETSYTINIPLVTITPDPTAISDNAFTNFTILKAACFIDESTARTKSTIGGVKAKIGPASLVTEKHIQGFEDILKLGPCAFYDKLKNEWMFSNGLAIESVLSPFTMSSQDIKTLL